ncbi:MAG: hypothetical protein ACRY3E_03995 [Candidatus Lariskella arthropodorum]
MQNCLSILGFLDAVYSVLQKSIPYRVLLYCTDFAKPRFVLRIRYIANIWIAIDIGLIIN